LSATPIRPTRTVGLAVIVIVLVLAQLLVLWLGIDTLVDRVTHGQSAPTVLIVSLALTVVAIGGFVGVWFWQRWAVYLVAAVIVVGLVMDVALGTPVFALVLRLVLVAAFAALVRKQWDDFR
jgi:hypothetical protein